MCVLINLSSAFDSIPHGLLIAKLNAYGVSMEACSYIMNYLSDRKQSVKIAHSRNNWEIMKRSSSGLSGRTIAFQYLYK